MPECSYHQLLKVTFENTLLHLYFKVEASRGFVKEEQRNKIIINFLKPKVKQARYSAIKKRLKLDNPEGLSAWEQFYALAT
ncbi:DUF2913 domain-containing protein [Vibrio sp. 10N.261.52.E5]|uniref:DUF2913 family protein n=1 Tax=Vibrio kanaloae TaxID=170673 RepID=A0A4V5R507_9VIBR|nr:MULTISPECIES: DUF2913 family protein [Vibrio]MDH5895414.1 DUF2913 family protein [Vibrio splendidus]OCH40999.1 DUF2913 domain-containing protein [Vibrio cyclitrophicus]OED87112.1 DUF2913 domain-containing protein [Vibrio cyclitrophicus ZF30]OEF41165.1 DUF2913 domain-containing protein [Vibrio cyclitrophicus 1F289]PMI82466.1 DUF2913 domain-containing protein [Vibrio splendidus]